MSDPAQSQGDATIVGHLRAVVDGARFASRNLIQLAAAAEFVDESTAATLIGDPAAPPLLTELRGHQVELAGLSAAIGILCDVLSRRRERLLAHRP